MRLPRPLDYLSPGAWIILGGAVVSAMTYLAWPAPHEVGREFWLFSPPNAAHYRTAAAEWNAAHPAPDERVNVRLIHYQAMERRLVAAFTSGTPVADLVETESTLMARVFAGSLSDVGFVDLTDRLKAEGLFEQINPPSFSLWTTRGRTFALPHDVHPCLLAYRADLVEAAGIDVSRIETWEDFRRVLAPLVVDLDGDGRPDRFLLNFWETNRDLVTVLLRQGAGNPFDDQNRLHLDTEANARVLASLVSWVAGPGRFCVDAMEFTAGGDRMRLDGTVLCSILPDWQAGTWKNNIPGLAGKVKVMRLPAWDPGGRRTSVWGGTALGIAKSAPNVETSWALAKHLYLSPRVAESLYRATNIISPVKSHWALPCYHEPDPYFSGQKVGEYYIAEAPNVPPRTASPYSTMIMERMVTVLVALKGHAQALGKYDPATLMPEARRLLDQAQGEIAARIDRNVLYRAPP
jgi:arabinosaccharide transport system substrate-binding protein